MYIIQMLVAVLLVINTYCTDKIVYTEPVPKADTLVEDSLADVVIVYHSISDTMFITGDWYYGNVYYKVIPIEHQDTIHLKMKPESYRVEYTDGSKIEYIRVNKDTTFNLPWRNQRGNY